jgi:NAD(P)-dependent dehydrogenase (short-subunit alcohol dehydrogenase family)
MGDASKHADRTEMVERFLGDLHDCQPTTDPRTNKGLREALKGKNVIIAGAGRGIGRATAEFFAHAGVKSLGLMALELHEVDETASICQEIHPDLKTKTAAFDVCDYAKTEEFVNSVEKDFGTIDVVFANAGRPPQWLSTAESDAKIWWDTLQVSLQGGFNFARAVLPAMRKQKSGKIIFTSSAGAHVGNGMGSYAIGKLGLCRLAEILHHENSDCNIKTFAIHPGAIQTRFFHDFKDAAEGNRKEGSYVTEKAPNEKKSAETAVGFFKDVSWDTPQMPAGYVVRLASGLMDYMSGRYVDCSRKVEDYDAEDKKIVQKDLHRVKLYVDDGWFIPAAREDQPFQGA